LERRPESDPAAQKDGASRQWSFLPYETEREVPRRELQLLRAVHASAIPFIDTVTISLAMVAAYFIADAWLNHGLFGGWLGANVGRIDSSLLLLSFATIPVWLLVFLTFGVYKREITRMCVSTFDEWPQSVGALAVAAWLSVSILLIAAPDYISFKAVWLFVACTWFMLLFLLPLARASFRMTTAFHNPFRTSALVVGAGEVGRSLIGRLNRHKEYGLRVVGFLDSITEEEGEEAGDVQILGRPSELREIVDRYGISRVLVAFSRAPYDRILEVIHECQEMKVDVSVVPRFFEALSERVEIEEVEGLTMASLPRYARHGRMMRATKRTLDLLGASLATLLLSPLLILVGILIRLDSPGPIFFRQERMGKGHRRFMMYKFRSMHADAEERKGELEEMSDASGPIFKMKEDPRVTRVGRFIRRTSIDELPQLINVFRGEMSLVGPRPLPVAEAESCTGTADMRHMVQPGITGLWQILGRSDIPFEEMVQLDYIYVTNWTLRWDLKIIIRTFIAILRKRGAY
jgi:exopolysaccharide biosynthesis polyprenyl glycosylphosphotransferase